MHLLKKEEGKNKQASQTNETSLLDDSQNQPCTWLPRRAGDKQHDWLYGDRACSHRAGERGGGRAKRRRDLSTPHPLWGHLVGQWGSSSPPLSMLSWEPALYWSSSLTLKYKLFPKRLNSWSSRNYLLGFGKRHHAEAVTTPSSTHTAPTSRRPSSQTNIKTFLDSCLSHWEQTD